MRKERVPNQSCGREFFFQGTPIFSTRTGPQTGQGQTEQNSQKQGGEGVRLGTHLTAGKVTCGGAQAAGSSRAPERKAIRACEMQRDVLGRGRHAVERQGSVGSVSHWAMTGGLQRKPGVETRQGVLLVGDEGR